MSTPTQRELGLIIGGIALGIALGQYVATQQAERSRLSSRLFSLESELRAERAHRTGEHAVPVRVVTVEGSPA